MAEDGIPDILAEQRLGHEVLGMRGLYTHVSERMRDTLIQALQARWDDSLRARAAIRGHSPIPLLDEMLAPYCRDQADTGTANGTVRHLTTRITPGRQGEVDLPIPPKQPDSPIRTDGIGPVLESLIWAFTWWAILGSNQ